MKKLDIVKVTQIKEPINRPILKIKLSRSKSSKTPKHTVTHILKKYNKMFGYIQTSRTKNRMYLIQSKELKSLMDASMTLLSLSHK